MENDMTTMAAEPALTHPMTSYEEMTRTCPLFPLSPVPRVTVLDDVQGGAGVWVNRKRTE